MSELRADHYDVPTLEVLERIQSVLQLFVEKPEGYKFEPVESFRHVGDTFGISFHGLGTVLLNYNRRSQAHASFTTQDGFEVSAGYRLRAGISVDPIPWDQRGGLQMRHSPDGEAEGTTYYPRRWQDGGYTLETCKRESLPWQVIDHIGVAVNALPQPFSPQAMVPLRVVE
jgi:hypothetical protein